jgi:hypothetical protein
MAKRQNEKMSRSGRVANMSICTMLVCIGVNRWMGGIRLCVVDGY